ncbi:MAG: UDP-glucose 4-epimerase GalE [Xanthomonadales bacterium]|jgi:UDP-glucose 4-epimerase|nr:UDP-glucose 4-epimerase GalE [Xanthomonadales bacterium]
MNQNRKILVTGGTGYIGSHAVLSLVDAGYDPVLLDNLCNSSAKVLDRLEMLLGRRPVFHEKDIRDREALDQVLRTERPAAVLHFAGLKAVGESVEQPERYQAFNVGGTRTLLAAMHDAGVHRLVFSSSATVYGDPDSVPIAENAPRRATNPYGQTKLDIEHMLEAHCEDHPGWAVACLRYFNPVGAHPSGRIGEDPAGIPNNLMPFISQVAVGRRDRLQVFGGDYETPDGTGVRDYIHVMDLVEGHVAMLRRLEQGAGLYAVNLGTGTGVSVLDMVRAFEAAAGVTIPFEIVDRRPGDVAACWADPRLAERLLGWRARRDLVAMCRDSWRWQRENPSGYD